MGRGLIIAALVVSWPLGCVRWEKIATEPRHPVPSICLSGVVPRNVHPWALTDYPGEVALVDAHGRRVRATREVVRLHPVDTPSPLWLVRLDPGVLPTGDYELQCGERTSVLAVQGGLDTDAPEEGEVLAVSTRQPIPASCGAVLSILSERPTDLARVVLWEAETRSADGANPAVMLDARGVQIGALGNPHLGMRYGDGLHWLAQDSTADRDPHVADLGRCVGELADSRHHFPPATWDGGFCVRTRWTDDAGNATPWFGPLCLTNGGKTEFRPAP
ncbi:MAG: hypothetical protein V4850_37250 [Myxococcota bacterium]